jgi:hypothetical protein
MVVAGPAVFIVYVGSAAEVMYVFAAIPVPVTTHPTARTAPLFLVKLPAPSKVALKLLGTIEVSIVFAVTPVPVTTLPTVIVPPEAADVGVKVDDEVNAVAVAIADAPVK